METEKNNWKDDELNREAEGKFLYEQLISRYKLDTNNEFESMVLNIDACWGLGKTFFLSRWESDLKEKGHPVVSFNAWNSDFQNDPMIAFITEIEHQLTDYFTQSKKAQALIKKTFKNGLQLFKNSIPLLSAILLKQMSGLSFDSIQEMLNRDDFDLNSLYEIEEKHPANETSNDNAQDDIEQSTSNNNKIVKSFVSLLSMYGKESLEKYIAQKKDIHTFRTNFSMLVKHIDKKLRTKEIPIFIIIDELDRCRPSYAIELLEVIKHLFSIKGVYFILATDTKQLCHSIKAIYGLGFDSSMYLNRFFNHTYELKEPDYPTYAKYLFSKYNNFNNAPFLYSPLATPEFLKTGNPNIEVFSVFSQYFKLSLRDQEQIVSYLYSISITWGDKKFKLHLILILFLLMLRHKSKEQFEYLQKYKFDIRHCQGLDKQFYENLDNEANITQGEYTNNSKASSYGVLTIVGYYRTYMSSTERNIRNLSIGNSDSLIKHKLHQQIITEFDKPGVQRSPHIKDVFGFMKYFDVVKQAGRFINEKNFEEGPF